MQTTRVVETDKNSEVYLDMDHCSENRFPLSAMGIDSIQAHLSPKNTICSHTSIQSHPEYHRQPVHNCSRVHAPNNGFSPVFANTGFYPVAYNSIRLA